MDELQVVVQAYYQASLMGDEETKKRVLSQLEELSVFLLLFYGRRALSQLSENINMLPTEISYKPSEQMIQRATADLRSVLEGLDLRLQEELTKAFENEDNEGLSEAEIIMLVAEANIWQIVRIVDSEDHIYFGFSELDIVTQLINEHGYTITKEWVAKIDDKTCSVCKAMHGQTVSFSEPFVYNGVEVTLASNYSDFANAHSHCRCRIKYHIERGE